MARLGQKKGANAVVNWPTTSKAPPEGWPNWINNQEIVSSRQVKLRPIKQTEDEDEVELDPPIAFAVPEHLNLKIAYQIGMEPRPLDRSLSWIPHAILHDAETQMEYEASIPAFDRGSAIKCQRCIASDPQKQCFHVSWSAPDPNTGEYPKYDSTGKAEDVFLDACLERMISGNEGSCTNVGRIVCGEGGLDHRVKPHHRPPPRSLVEALGLPDKRRNLDSLADGDSRLPNNIAGRGSATDKNDPITVERDVPRTASSITAHLAGHDSNDTIRDGTASLEAVTRSDNPDSIVPSSAGTSTTQSLVAVPHPSVAVGIGKDHPSTASSIKVNLATQYSDGAKLDGTARLVATEVTRSFNPSASVPPSVEPLTSQSLVALPHAAVPVDIGRSSSPLSSAPSSGTAADCTSPSHANPSTRPHERTCAPSSNPVAAHPNEGCCAVPVTGAQSALDSARASSDGNPFVILPTTAYSLNTDPVHKYTAANQRAVSVPDFDRAFQLARECLAYMWPHNAERLGFKRWIPQSHQLQIKGAMFAVRQFNAQRGRTDIQNVWPAFMYCLPGVHCNKCKSQGRPCIFAHWICMPPDEAGLPKVGTDQMHEIGPFLDACMGCWQEMDGLKARMDQCTVAGVVIRDQKKATRFKTNVGVIQAAETAINRWLISPFMLRFPLTTFAVRKPTTSQRGKKASITNAAPPHSATELQIGGMDVHQQAVDHIAKLLAPGEERVKVLEAEISAMQGEKQRMAETITSQAKEIGDAGQKAAATKVDHDRAIETMRLELEALRAETETARSSQISQEQTQMEEGGDKLAKAQANIQRLEDTNRDLNDNNARLQLDNSRLKVTANNLRLEVAQLTVDKDQERVRAETAERRRDYYRGEAARLQALRDTSNSVVVDLVDDE